MHPASSGLPPVQTVYATYVPSVGMVATYPAGNNNFARKVTRINVTGVAGSTVRIYRDAISPISLIDSNNIGSANTAEYTNPIVVQRGNQIFVVWPGINDANNQTTATFYQEVI